MSFNHLTGSNKSYWDKRENLKNKPSLSHRTLEVVSHLMEEESISLGIALEKIMLTDGLYMNIVDTLSVDYDDIKKD